MNIAILATTFLPQVGGQEWKVHYLATEYVKLNHDVTVFASRPSCNLRNTELQVNPTYKLIRCGWTFTGVNRIGLNGLAFRRLVGKYHKREHFDVIHCHPLGEVCKYATQIKQKYGIPVVATTSGEDIQYFPEINYGRRLNKKYEMIVRDNLQKIDVVGSISRAVRADIESLSPKAKIIDIPNGVAWDDFQIGTSRYLRTELNLQNDCILILSVGRNHIKKGYEYSIKAFAKVAYNCPNAYYVLVGKDTTKLQALVEQLGISHQVRLVEQLPMSKIPEVYRSVDIFFNPSLIEGFAQVNVQALACSLPCVITDSPGNVDGADFGGTLIAKERNIDSMADSLIRLIRDPELRRQLSAQAYEASKHYSWTNIAKQYLDVFETLIN